MRTFPAPEPRPAPADSAPPTLDVRGVALAILAAIAVMLVLKYAQAMIIPIVVAVLIRYALEPIVAGMERIHIPRSLGAALLLLALVGAGGRLLYGLRTEATAIVEQLPQAARRLRQALEATPKGAPSAIQQMQKAAQELERAADAAAPPPTGPAGVARVRVEEPPFDVAQYVFWGSIGVATAIGQLTMILFLVYFMLASGDLYRRKLMKMAGSVKEKRLTVEILSDIDRQIGRFLLVQLSTGTVVAVATWLAFRALGVEQAGVWGIAAGVFNSIPYFGPVLVTAGTVAIALLQFGTLQMAIVVGAVALVITTLEGFLLTPWLMGRAARMNAVAVFVGLIFWSWVWDVWGMLLAVPMLVVIKSICDHVEGFKDVSELLAD